MEAIVLTDDELQRLETRFGLVVRQMGTWNSDGVFGYASVPIVAVEKAAEIGPALVERITAAYRELSPWPPPTAPVDSRTAR
ncbi:MAG: hypothetical protein ABSF54_29640 [Bryobacteraceae bacterium]|jgi:hypothetical protein